MQPFPNSRRRKRSKLRKFLDGLKPGEAGELPYYDGIVSQVHAAAAWAEIKINTVKKYNENDKLKWLVVRRNT